MLFIRPIEGYLTRQTNTLLSMDPYCILTYEEQEFKTAPNYGGGNRPKWNETFTFNAKTMGKLKAEVKSRSMIGNDQLVGKGELDLRKLMLVTGKAIQDHIQLTYQGKPSGKITLEIALTTPAQRKNPIFSEKQLPPFRTSLPDLASIKQIPPIDKTKIKQELLKQQNKTKNLQPQKNNNLLFSFGNPKQQTDKKLQNLHKQKQDKISNAQKLTINNIQPKPELVKTQQNIKQQKQIKPIAPINIPNQKVANQPQNNNNNNQNVQGLIQNRVNNQLQQPNPQQQLRQPVQPSQHIQPSQPIQLNKQYPLKHKINNGIIPSQNPIKNQYPQQNPTTQPYPNQLTQNNNRAVDYQKESNKQSPRYNHQMQKFDKTQKVGIGKTPPKSILSPGKNRKSKSNKKVKFEM